MVFTRVIFLIVGCVFVKGQGQDPIAGIDHPHPHPDPRGLGPRLPSIINNAVTDLTSRAANTLGETRPDGASVTGVEGMSGGTDLAGAQGGTQVATGAETRGFVSDSGPMDRGTAAGGRARAGGFVGGNMNTAAGGFVGDPQDGGAPGAGRMVGSTMNRVAPGTDGFVGDHLSGRASGTGRIVGSTMNRVASDTVGFVGGPLPGRAPGTGGFVGSAMNRGMPAGGFIGGAMNRGTFGAGGLAGSTMVGGTPNTMRGLSDPLRISGGAAGRDIRMQAQGGAGSPRFDGGPQVDPRFAGQRGFVTGDMAVAGARGGFSMRGSSRPTIMSSGGLPIAGGASVPLPGGAGAPGPVRGPFYDAAGQRIPDPASGLTGRDLIMRTGGDIGGGLAHSSAGTRNTMTPGFSAGTGVRTTASTGGMARLMPGGVPFGRMAASRGLGPIMESGAPGLIGAGVPTGAGIARGGPMTGPSTGGTITRVDPLTGRPIAGASFISASTGIPTGGRTLTGAPLAGVPPGSLMTGSTMTGAPMTGMPTGPLMTGPMMPGARFIDPASGLPLAGPAMTGRYFGTFPAGDVRYIPGMAPVGATGGLSGGAVRTLDGRFVSAGGTFPAGAATTRAILPGTGGAFPTGVTAPGGMYTGLGGPLTTDGSGFTTGDGALSTSGDATTLPDGIVMTGGNASSTLSGDSMRFAGGYPGVGSTSGMALPPGSIVLPGTDMRGSGGRIVYERRLLGSAGSPGLIAPGATTMPFGPGFRYATPFPGNRYLPASSLYPAGGLRYMSGGPIIRPGVSVLPGFTRGPGLVPPMFTYPIGRVGPRMGPFL